MGFSGYLAAAAMVMLSLSAEAERLSLKVYTNAEGITDNTARPLLASKRGYLWVATGPDLARFDGHSFRIYSTAEGWNGGRPFSMTETADGQIYIGAGFGLYQLDANARAANARFRRIELPGSSREIEYIFEDSQRRLWVSGYDDAFLRDASGKWRVIGEVKPTGAAQSAKVQQAAEDSNGDVWLASFSGIRCLRKSGEIERYTHADYPQLSNFAIAAVRGPDNRMYFGFENGGVARLARPDEVRRDILLIFKESVHNAAKHSGCSRVAAELSVQGGDLVLRVQDNGRGFAPSFAAPDTDWELW